MKEFLAAHGGDLAIVAMIVLLVFLCVRSLIRDRRAGKAPCGLPGCQDCGLFKACDAIPAKYRRS